MDHHHHHEDHVNHMTKPPLEANQEPVLSMGEPSSIHHHHHHHQHAGTFQLWTASSLLVQSWSLDTPLGLAAAMLFSTFLSVMYEGSKFYYHIGKILIMRNKNTRRQSTLFSHYVSRMWKALAFMFHFFIGYILMLCAMTFNLWLLIAVCLGAGIGYFFLLPLVQHVIQKDMDFKAQTETQRDPVSINSRCPREKRRNCDTRTSRDIDDQDEGEILLQQISDVRVNVERETVL